MRDTGDRSALLDVGADGTLRFAASSGVAALLEPNDVVVSEPSAAAPFGLLRKVTSVQVQGDEVVVATVGAELRDAVHQGSLNVRLELDESQLASSVAHHPGIEVQGFDHTIDTDFGTGGLLQVTGSLQIDPILDLDIGIGCDDKFLGICTETPDLNVLVRVGVEETADLKIEASADLDFDDEFQVASHDFSTLTFFIGPVPVVLTPRLELYLTASGSLSAELSFDAEQDLTLVGGFTFNSDEGFDDISQDAASFDHSGVDFSGVATARAAFGGRFQLRLYGVIGPFGSLEAGPRLTASQQGLPGTGGLLWRLEGCLTGIVGIDSVDVLDLQYESELFDLCTTFANEGNEPPSVFIEVPTTGSQIFENETITLRAIALDPAGTNATDNVTIDVDPEPQILVTIVTPEDLAFVRPTSPTLLEASASGGAAPYAVTWSVAYPTDIDGNGGTLFEGIGTTASFEWTPSDDLPVTECQGFSFGRLSAEAVDADTFGGSRSVTIRIGEVC